MTKSFIIVIPLIFFMAGCGKGPEENFASLVNELKVPELVEIALQDFGENRINSVEKNLSVLRSFCARRQISFRREPTDLPPILSKNDIQVLFGDPNAFDDDGHWIYYINKDKTWYLRLEFRGEYLFLTGYRKLMPAENLTGNNPR
jgi:hypothetical protein